MSVVFVALAASLAIAGAESAPQAAPVQPATSPDLAAASVSRLADVVVEGRQLDALVRSFVVEVAEPAKRRGLARWNRPICVGSVNLQTQVGQYIVDRVSDVARELEVEAGEPGCRPNVLIVGTVDGAALASALVEDRPRNFDLRHNGTDAGTRAFRGFRTDDRPVRWWQISMPIDSETGQRAVRLPGDPSPPVIHGFAASRLRTQIRDDMVRAVIIIVVDRLDGANLVQLGDYVAMVSLAQIDPEAETAGYDTVLNLFADPASGPDGLTDWDMSYLEAMYQHDQLRINRNSQVQAVADAVLRDRRAANETPAN